MSTSFYQTVYDYNLLPPSTSTCLTNKTLYNTSFNDTKNNLNVLKDSTCLSDDVKFAEDLERELREKEALVARFEKQKAIFDSYIESVGVLQNAKGPIDTFMQDLESQQSALTAEQYALQQKIRAGRRRFLDAEPQAGTTSILGLQTTDDKILLAFWICFLTGISVATAIFLLKYGESMNLLTPQQKITVFLGFLLACGGLAFFFIRRYA
jgi:hypothetical protein